MLHKRTRSKLSKPDRGFWDGCKNTTCQEMEPMFWKSLHSAVITFLDTLFVPFIDTPCFLTHLWNLGNQSISASHRLCKLSLSDHAMSTYSLRTLSKNVQSFYVSFAETTTASFLCPALFLACHSIAMKMRPSPPPHSVEFTITFVSYRSKSSYNIT
jgi:hypothetical protein